MRISLLTVFLFAIALAVMGHRNCKINNSALGRIFYKFIAVCFWMNFEKICRRVFANWDTS